MGKIAPEYRSVVNPVQFDEFLNGAGALADRQTIADAFDYDWHARKLSFAAHFRGQVLMQATAYQSTHDHQWAAAHDPLFAACGARVEISVSGLAQANRNRPLEPLHLMLQQVLDAVGELPHRRLRALDKETWGGIVAVLQRSDLFDATTLKLPPKVRAWAPGKSGNAALKLQLRLDAQSGHFKQLLFTPATGNDSPYFETLLGDLGTPDGQIFVFDAGYLDLETYQAIVESGNHFVTKASRTLKPHVIEERPVPDGPLASGYEVRQDSLVYFGDEERQPYRAVWVQLTTGKQITLLSSLLDVPADHICLLYRYRWTIEIVFRWLRQHLQLDHFMSHDPVGIVRQILMALIVWGLLVIANQDQTKLSPKQLWRQLQADLHQALLEFGYRLGLQQAPLPT
ncbi:MAG: IS4 family transposase [Candidatus Binatia bacterium]